MAKLIVGLGNPGVQYAKTRHNVGFLCIERMMETLAVHKAKAQWHSLVAEASIAGEKVYLLRPQTFMNLSGTAVREAINYLKLNLAEQVLVIYDDMDLPVGKIRLRMNGSAGGHNGMKSIIENVGQGEFQRIRIGIGRPPFDMAVVDHVLSRFAKAEWPAVQDAINRSAEAALEACHTPFPSVMNTFNSRA